jgi:hypothetical protein
MISANDFVPSGAPLHVRGGLVSGPSPVHRRGITPPWEKHGEDSVNVIDSRLDGSPAA